MNNETLDQTIANHKSLTDDDMETWKARVKTGYIGYMVKDDDCCPGAVKTVMADIERLVAEVIRLRSQSKALYEALESFAHARSILGRTDHTVTSVPYEAFNDARTAVHNYENAQATD